MYNQKEEFEEAAAKSNLQIPANSSITLLAELLEEAKKVIEELENEIEELRTENDDLIDRISELEDEIRSHGYDM